MNNLEQKILLALLEQPHRFYISNAGVFRFPPNYKFNIHNHREIEIIYINSGHCILKVEDEFVPMKKGDCLSIPAGRTHSFGVDNKGQCSITQLEFQMEVPESLGEELVFLRQDEKYYKLTGCETVRYLMESMSRFFRLTKNKEEREAQLAFGFFQLFIELSAKIRETERLKKKARKNGKTEEVIQYINENYDGDITMEQVAEKFGLSSRYIRKCFSEETGMSCQQYITALRIERSKELLWFTSDTATEIALNVGFNSSQYFSRVFQQHMEMTPLEYRNLWRGTKAKELCVFNEEKVRRGKNGEYT